MYVELLGASYELLLSKLILYLWFALCPSFWKAFSWDKHKSSYSQILCMDAESSLCYVR